MSGDGTTDVVVGAPDRDLAGTDDGTAWLVLGPLSATVVPEPFAIRRLREPLRIWG